MVTMDDVNRRVEDQNQEIEDLQDKVDMLDSELDTAIRVAIAHGATKWAQSNYPKHPAVLELEAGPSDPS